MARRFESEGVSTLKIDQTLQQSLFGGSPMPPAEHGSFESKEQKQRRRAKICYSLTGEAWKQAVYSFAKDVFLPGRGSFIVQSLTEAYDDAAKANGWPLTIKKRAMAGVTARLLKDELITQLDGVLERRDQGNWTQVYGSNL